MLYYTGRIRDIHEVRVFSFLPVKLSGFRRHRRDECMRGVGDNVGPGRDGWCEKGINSDQAHQQDKLADWVAPGVKESVVRTYEHHRCPAARNNIADNPRDDGPVRVELHVKLSALLLLDTLYCTWCARGNEGFDVETEHMSYKFIFLERLSEAAVDRVARKTGSARWIIYPLRQPTVGHPNWRV
ncbi:hypothetical protein BJV78DRAFT_1155865 [Lactifluus subvellereus]|nr:hypothetical protein BJV78DRAFT_1155865 [Lactifluus subvellereus]